MRARFLLLHLTMIVVAAAGVARAHPLEPGQTGPEARIAHEIQHVREAMRNAIAEKSVLALLAFYAPNFTHTHGSGKVDGRDTRIVSVLAGEPVIETARYEELLIRAPHADTAIVTARSPILNRAENRDYEFRWIQVWARVNGDWRLFASQATRLPLAP